ncbi:hypothetical protein M514_05319, partial [Trichuris suis]
LHFLYLCFSEAIQQNQFGRSPWKRQRTYHVSAYAHSFSPSLPRPAANQLLTSDQSVAVLARLADFSVYHTAPADHFGGSSMSCGGTYDKRWSKPRQEISCMLKYFLFFFNFIVWTVALIIISLGTYMYAKEFRPVREFADLALNPCVALMVLGSCVFAISFLGCAGSLRENICLLKIFSLCLFASYICLVIAGFLTFILFYSDSTSGVSLRTLLMVCVAKYHVNDNIKDVVDYIQSQLTCCGVTAQGYRDWSSNALYNCTKTNLAPERCGVPHSCCKQDGLPENSVPSVVCGFGAQEKPVTELVKLIHSNGCLQQLQRAFEGNAVIMGAAIGAVILPVCLFVTLSNLLARQIAKQRYLLERQARREERHARRLKHRFRDPLAHRSSNSAYQPAVHLYDEVVSPVQDDRLIKQLTQEDLLCNGKIPDVDGNEEKNATVDDNCTNGRGRCRKVSKHGRRASRSANNESPVTPKQSGCTSDKAALSENSKMPGDNCLPAEKVTST